MIWAQTTQIWNNILWSIVLYFQEHKGQVSLGHLHWREWISQLAVILGRSSPEILKMPRNRAEHLGPDSEACRGLNYPLGGDETAEPRRNRIGDCRWMQVWSYKSKHIWEINVNYSWFACFFRGSICPCQLSLMVSSWTELKRTQEEAFRGGHQWRRVKHSTEVFTKAPELAEGQEERTRVRNLNISSKLTWDSGNFSKPLKSIFRGMYF
jgi:hypothetical protein